MEDFLKHCWLILLDLSPWLIFGMAVAGVLHIIVPERFIRRHLGSRNLGSLVKAAVVGVPMPLCSCGVIPTAIGLKEDGASDGAAVSFLISTPQTGVDSIFVSATFLGWPFAIFKIVAAFVTGIIGGLFVNLSPAPPAPAHESGSADSCAARPRVNFMREFFHFAFIRLLGGIYLWIIIGVAISALIGMIVPDDYFRGVWWMQGLGGMLVMLVIALPLYVCSTGSVPIAASLIAAGMPAGAALVFLMAGPATNIATLGAVFKTFGRRVLGIYLGTVVVMSIVLGLLFDFLIEGVRSGGEGMMHTLPHPVQFAATLLLVFFLAAFLARDAAGWVKKRLKSGRKKMQNQADVEKIVLSIKGMTCGHCTGRVQKALESVPGVVSAEVDLGANSAVVSGTGLDMQVLADAVAQAGYEATGRSL